jgi:hypothetical protein
MPFWSKPKAKVYAEIRLPGIRVGTNDVDAFFRKGGGETYPETAPFLLIARCCGLALDTGKKSNNGVRPILWSPHGDRHQLWYLRPSGHEDEVLIASADNGLVLDATEQVHPKRLVLWEAHGKAWQRWRLAPTPDGAGYFIASTWCDRVLASREGTIQPGQLSLADRDGDRRQQWLLATPHGETIKH